MARRENIMIWPTKKLGEICKISSGGSAPQGERFFENGEYPFFRTSDVGEVHLSDNLCDVRDYLNDQGIKKLNLFKKGTILFPKSGASTFLNHRVIMGCDGYVASHLATITAGEKIDFKYLYFFLILVDARDIAPNSSYPSLRIADIAKIEIPLPPVLEQRRIVVKLEGVLAKIGEAKKLRAEARENADNLLSAELHKIFEEGKKKGWEEKTVEYVTNKIQYGYTASAKQSGTARLLRITDIQNNQVNWDEVPYCDCEDAEKYKLHSGDIVFARTGATVGKSFLIKNPPKNAVFASYLIRANVNIQKCSSEFLYYFFQSPNYWNQIIEQKAGGAQPNVNGAKLKKLTLPLPPLADQKEIVARLDLLSEKIGKIKALQSQTSADFTNLEQSILHRAFSGVL